MRKFSILTPFRTTYVIDEDGCFLQYGEHKWKHPHTAWKCTGCAEIRPFGNLRFFDLASFIELIENGEITTFKNGKPRFTLTDKDHGTFRVHGNTKYHGVRSVVELR